MIGLTKALALDSGPYRIGANAIAPGVIARGVVTLQDDPSFVEFFPQRARVGRSGTARTIGPATLFLASLASGCVTGATLAVDGRWLAN